MCHIKNRSLEEAIARIGVGYPKFSSRFNSSSLLQEGKGIVLDKKNCLPGNLGCPSGHPLSQTNSKII